VADILIIGYGNGLRGDDGLGPFIAESLAAAKFPGVLVLTPVQLLPELSAQLAEARLAVFVDASVESCEVGRAIRLQAAKDTRAWCTHHAAPCTLLALTRAVYGRTPQAWWLPVPGRNFGYGERFSDVAKENALAAIVHLTSFIREQAKRRPPGL
jgi:hydrogenase maturation protease